MPTSPTPRLLFALLSFMKMSTARHHGHILLATRQRTHRRAFSSLPPPPRRQVHSTHASFGGGNRPHPPSLQASTNAERNSTFLPIRARFLPESAWRQDAALHAERIRALLSPGLIVDHARGGARSSLDPRHPIYNFLIEYYGIKGSKGVHRLMRWCPAPLWSCRHPLREEDTIRLNVSLPTEDTSSPSPSFSSSSSPSSVMATGVFLENATVEDIASGVLHLRGATFIHHETELSADRGSRCQQSRPSTDSVTGILYCPKLYFGQKDVNILRRTAGGNDTDSRMPHKAASAFLWYRTLLKNTLRSDPILYCHGMHEWAMLYNPDLSSAPPPSSKFQSHLSLRIPQQIINEQVERRGIRCTHIDALRFFAPEARKWNWYGSLEDLSEEEWESGMLAKRNVKKHCLSSMREDAKSSHHNNDHPHDDTEPIQQSANAILTRKDQLHLEQKACLHANMDLFKIAWRLQPFLSSTLLAEALTVALRARTLDVEASPYDVSGYLGLCWSHDGKTEESGDTGVLCGTKPLGAVKVETEEGRKEYQWRQVEVMKRGDVVRKKLLRAYTDFLRDVFGIEDDEAGEFYNAFRGRKIQVSNPEQVINDAVHSK